VYSVRTRENQEGENMTQDLREALEQQVEEWREFTEVVDWSDYSHGVNEGVKSCAKDIEELLQESENE